MGKIARYIDALPDEARDRVIEAQGWCVTVGLDDDGRCLVGHTEDWREVGDGDIAINCVDVAKMPGGSEGYECVGEDFDAACARFGLDRVVRACKLRAGRPNRVTLPDPVRDIRGQPDATPGLL
jgi:hypothetical protein